MPPGFFSRAGSLERSAAWELPWPSSFDPGGGPTIAHTLEVSKRSEDVRLVRAAAAADLAAVEAALAAANINAHVRLPSFLRATTALHAASAAGAVDVARRLLEARADVSGRHGQLRALTPLHDAGNAELAGLLLEARAAPWAADPREPDPAWYHEQRGRASVAALIRQQRASLEAPTSSSPVTTAARQLPALPLSSAELQALRAAFSAKGASLVAREGAVDVECSICMLEMAPEDDVLCLPCWQTASPSEESPTAGAEGSPSRRSHSFHAKCLDRWLLTKAGACPICRCNVRQLARASVAPSPKSAPQPRPPRLPRNARPGARGARSARASRSAESQRALQEMLPVIGGRALLVSRSAQLLQ
eukprot:s2541_g14.t1